MATRRGSRSPGKSGAARERSAASPPAVSTEPVLPATAERFPHRPAPGDSNGPYSAPDLVVEVEFISPAAAAAAQAALAGPQGAAGSAPTAHPAWVAMLGRYRPLEMRSAHTDEQLQMETTWQDALRAQAAVDASAASQWQAVQRVPDMRNFVRLRFPGGTPRADLMAELRTLPTVVRALRVPRAAPPDATPPTDPLIGSPDAGIATNAHSGLESQWYLHRLQVPQAWRRTRGADTIIAAVDWGFEVDHEELSAAIEKRFDVVSRGVNVRGSRPDHGTAVLGLAGARADGQGICGVAPEATLWAILGSGGGQMVDTWAAAIDHVRMADSGGRRKIIVVEVQTEFGGNFEQVGVVQRAVRAAIAAGCVVCVAAGNGACEADLNDDGEPFDPTGSILVGATKFAEDGNRRASFSNFGPRVVVSAPGDRDHDVTCGIHDRRAYTNRFGGTSGAVPKIAGIAALMLSVNPDLSHDEVRDILVGSGTPVVEEPDRSIGVFANARSAVNEALRRAGSPVAMGLEAHGYSTSASQLQGLKRRASQKMSLDEDEPRQGPVEGFARSPTDPSIVDRPLRVFRATVAGTLTQAERQLLVEQAILLLENFYVHRTLKEAIHAVKPVQRLRVWLQRLRQSSGIPLSERDELGFHNTMTQIFNSVRDLHTSYQLPQPYSDYIAYLPFEVAPCVDRGRIRYLITRVLENHDFLNKSFGVGAELLHWNGMDMERAVLANGEQTAGSNDAARRARGVSALTLRAMNTMLPPSADHVDIDFVPAVHDPGRPDARQSVRQQWLVRYAPQGDRSGRVAGTAGDDALVDQQAVIGLDATGDAMREARQIIFEAELLDRLQSAPEGAEHVGSGLGTSAVGGKEVPVRMPWNLIFRARIVDVEDREIGHIQIHTFSVTDIAGFQGEFVRLLQLMPSTGLVLDVRGNGGGSIWAAERLLQTLTAVEIEPERMQFIATAGTRELCRNNARDTVIPLGEWIESLDEAVETGSVYSRGFSITEAGTCNSIGQQYYGPVLLLIDGNCYSATDMFAAGFQDHDIGPILGVAAATGAGGANVWSHDLLTRQLPANWGLVPLPAGAGMRVALRQALRVGPRSGALLEDFGVKPNEIHTPTRDDLVHGERDLFRLATSMLAQREARAIMITQLTRSPGTTRQIELRVATVGLHRLDCFVDGRPHASNDLRPDAEGRASLELILRSGTRLRLLGYAKPDDPHPVAVYSKLMPP